MKRILKRFLTVTISALLVLTISVPVFATTASEAMSRIEQLRAEQAGLQGQINDMRANAANTEAFIAELDIQIRDVVEKINIKQNEINAKEVEIAAKTEEIAKTQAELEEALATEARQYENLKARIKVMYEQDSMPKAQRYMELLMNADSLGDFLNNSKYTSEISKYDANLLLEYKATRQRIADLKAKLVKDRIALEEAKLILEQEKAVLQDEMDKLELMLREKEAELVTINSKIAEAKLSLEQAQQAEWEMEEILAAIKAQQQAQQSGGGQNGYFGGNTTVTDSGASGYIGLLFPTNGYISSTFGDRDAPTAGASTNHQGIDIGAAAGTPIYASAAGTVVTSGYSSVRGNYIVISHGNGTSTLYQHNSENYVSVGQQVVAGQVIGTVGSTGVSTGAHLHFEVIVNGANQNPLAYVTP